MNIANFRSNECETLQTTINAMHTVLNVYVSHLENADGGDSGLLRLSSLHVLLPSIFVPLVVFVCCLVGCIRHHRRYKRHRSSCSSVTAAAKQPRHSASRTSNTSYLLLASSLPSAAADADCSLSTL